MSEHSEQLLDNDIQKESSVLSSLKDDSYISKNSAENTNDHIYETAFNVSNDADKARSSNGAIKHVREEDKRDANVKDSQPLGLFGNNNNIIQTKNIKVLVFQDESQISMSVLNRKKFAVVSNDLVTTFLIGNESFSQFSHPKLIEHDNRVNVYMFEKEKHKDEYICNDINEFISHLGIDNTSNELSQNLQLFLQTINEIFLNKNYLSIKRCHLCWTMLCIFIILGLLAITTLSTISLVQIYNNSAQIIALSNSVLVTLICGTCVLMVSLIYYSTTLPLLLRYKKMNYLWQMHKDNVALVNKWNRSIFEANRIKVSVPPSLEYIMFNKDPSQDIQIRNIHLDHIKAKFNPSLAVEPIVFKDDNKMFHKENV